jgi:hypothetical protein
VGQKLRKDRAAQQFGEMAGGADGVDGLSGGSSTEQTGCASGQRG